MQRLLTDRTYLMCPNMAFGLAFEVSLPLEEERVCRTLDMLAVSHPLLRSKVSARDARKPGLAPDYVYDVGDASLVALASGTTPMEDFERVTSSPWDLLGDGLLKVFIYPSGPSDGTEPRFGVLFVAARLLGDGRAIASLMLQFADAYATGEQPPLVEDPTIGSADDLPAQARLTGVPAVVARRLNRAWEREATGYGYADYLSALPSFLSSRPVAHARMAIEPDAMEAFRERCDATDVSTDSALMAATSIAFQANECDLDVDVSDDVRGHVTGSLGNHASTMRVDCSGGAGNLEARSASIERKVCPQLADTSRRLQTLSFLLSLDLDLVGAIPAAGLGLLPSDAARRAARALGYGMPDVFGLTNLGAYDSALVSTAEFIPPAPPMDARTVGVVTMNGRTSMACSSYADTPEQARARLEAACEMMRQGTKTFPWTGSPRKLLG
jgi:hypothetical protein